MFQAQYRVICDTPDCGAVRDGWAPDRRAAWRDARDAGWERDYAEHRCPACGTSTRTVARLRVLAAAGYSDRRAGADVGISRAQVQRLRTRNNIPGQRPGRPSGSKR